MRVVTPHIESVSFIVSRDDDESLYRLFNINSFRHGGLEGGQSAYELRELNIIPKEKVRPHSNLINRRT